ncbi:MAG: serine hydrolase [Oscillospiraceae bacterium]
MFNIKNFKNIKWNKLLKDIKSFFINGADFIKYKFLKFVSEIKNSDKSNADEKAVKDNGKSFVLAEYAGYIKTFLHKNNAVKYISLSVIMFLCAIVGYSFSFLSTDDTDEKSVYVEITTTEPVVTTVPETTSFIETTETEATLPDLTKDVFEGGKLEILHTDFKPSKEMEDEINRIVNGYNKNFSIYMVNLEDYAVFGYNSDVYVPTASTIKCPFAFYCYKEIEKGNHSFDDTLLYKSGYYSSGTGVLKDSGSGTYYKVRTLLNYMIHYSDNVAFLMLQDYFGYEGYNEMMESYGFETYLNGQIKWGKLSSHALGYIWTQIFDYRNKCEEGEIFYHDLVYAGSNFLIWPMTEAGYSYNIAHKSGWASPGYHDSGIVLSEHPYVLVIMTESEGETRDSGFFYNMTIAMNDLHDEYLEYLGQQPSQKGAVTPEEFMPVENEFCSLQH